MNLNFSIFVLPKILIFDAKNSILNGKFKYILIEIFFMVKCSIVVSGGHVSRRFCGSSKRDF